MAAQTRLFQQADDLGTLRELLDLAKNPKAIVDAHEEARKQVALTKMESQKAQEAREAIAKHETLSADLKQRENKLAAEKTEHELCVRQFVTECDAHAQRFAEYSAAQDAIAKRQDAKSIELEAERQQLNAQLQAIEAKRQGLDTEMSVREKAVKSAEANIDSAKAQLETDRLALKQKAAKIKEQAADF